MMFDKNDPVSYYNPFLKENFRGTPETAFIEAEFYEVPPDEVMELEEVEGTDYKEILPALAPPEIPFHVKLKQAIDSLQTTNGFGIKWVARKLPISKKKIEKYLQTGEGLTKPQLQQILFILSARCEKEIEIEKAKAERQALLKKVKEELNGG